MSRGFSIAHSQVTPGMDARSHQISGASIDGIAPGNRMLEAGAGNESALDGDVSPMHHELQRRQTQGGTIENKGGYMNFYCDQEEEDLTEIKQRTEKHAETTKDHDQIVSFVDL